jgi:DNA replication protein DnaC
MSAGLSTNNEPAEELAEMVKKPNVLVIEEVTYDNLNQGQMTLFFQIINVRYEHGSIIITTNKPFSM